VNADEMAMVADKSLTKIPTLYNTGETSVRNPFGKSGALHQSTIQGNADDIISRGYNVRHEVKYDVVNGVKSFRYADVVAMDKTGTITEIYQVGKLAKSGFPVKRELVAIKDIFKSPIYNKASIIFVPYNL
jgi:hypothetical protein